MAQVCWMLPCVCSQSPVGVFFMHVQLRIKYPEISYSLLIKIFYVLNRWIVWSQIWLQGSRFMQIVSVGSLWYASNFKWDLHNCLRSESIKGFCWLPTLVIWFCNKFFSILFLLRLGKKGKKGGFRKIILIPSQSYELGRHKLQMRNQNQSLLRQIQQLHKNGAIFYGISLIGSS